MCQTVKANVEGVGSVGIAGVVVGVTPALHSRGCCRLPDFQRPRKPGIPRHCAYAVQLYTGSIQLHILTKMKHIHTDEAWSRSVVLDWTEGRVFFG